ncbi:unnamed protein product [Alopecurus aequalis]
MMAAYRLSELPNDLLRRVLHFAPLKEAASTTALSRRWRAALYLSSGAVNIETGVEKRYYSSLPDDSARFFAYRDAFDSAALGALDAATVPVTRLTLRLESDLHIPAADYMTRWRDDKDHVVVSRYTGLVDAVLSRRAARRVEELRLDAKKRDDYYYANWVGFYTVRLNSLPSETLRVLELNNCRGLLYQSQAPAVVLPRLSSLRLTYSVQHLSSLQNVIDAAPALGVVRLEHIQIDATDEAAKKGTTRRLRCPAATMLVLDSCLWVEEKQTRSSYSYETTVDVDGVEIDATRLRHFRYNGPVRNFSFSPLPSELENVDVDFFKHGYKGNSKDPNHFLENFWRFAWSFSNTKEMRLSVDHLEDIAILSEVRRVELLPSFHRLHRLEVQGVHWMKVKISTVMAVLNLLLCCPVLSALRINLTAKHEYASNKEGAHTRIPQEEIQIAAMLGPRHFYRCLQSSLTRVGLQFQLEKSDCLGVKLIKFFAENAMVLKEMCIDGGDKNLCREMSPRQKNGTQEGGS